MNSYDDSFVSRFLKQESAGGVLLVSAAIVAMIFANSPLSAYYDLLIDTPVAVHVGEFALNKPLLLWVNDGLMALFFLLVGLELKREVLEGELSQPGKIVLPAIGAAGGMAVPALIYSLLNADHAVDIKGWAIPAATDIAFALGVLSLLGPRVPVSLKVFLTSLAIFDDIGAIIIIALFYTSNISVGMLAVSSACCLALLYLNRRQVAERSIYLFFGLIMWLATLQSGVHATLAGVLLAMFIPMRSTDGRSPLKNLESDLHAGVAFIILPVFAFCNAGINLQGTGLSHALHDVPLGIALGLFLGNQIGVTGFCWLAIRMKLAQLPEGMSWCALWGTAALCGVGFTMSLFISSLAFEETGVNLAFDERLGIIIGSLASGLTGFAILRFALPSAPDLTNRRT